MVRSSSLTIVLGLLLSVVLLCVDNGHAQNLPRFNNGFWALNEVAQWQYSTVSQAVQANAEGTEKNSKVTRKGSSGVFLNSLLIPGWGQLKMGRKKAGYAFLAAEAILIGSVIFTKKYGAWLEDDYKTFAAQHASIGDDADHQYYIDIGNWMDRQSYNEQRLRDRDFEAVYTDQNSDWQWDNDGNRRTFKNIRVKSDYYKQASVMLVGGILINHFVSAVEAGRSESRQKATASVIPINDDGVGVRLNVFPASFK